MENPKNIELRSEQIRDIIGQIPPFLIRCGNGILCLFFILLTITAAYVPLPHRTTTDIYVDEILPADTCACWKVQIPGKLIPLLPQAKNISFTLDNYPDETFIPLQSAGQPIVQKETGEIVSRTIPFIIKRSSAKNDTDSEGHRMPMQGQLHLELPPSPFLKRFFLHVPSS